MVAQALPGTLFIAAICVIVSRVANFQPGYLYGLIIGFGFARELSKVAEGRLVGHRDGHLARGLDRRLAGAARGP